MDAVFDQSQKLVEFWADLGRRMMPAMAAFDPSNTPPEAARQLRSVMLDAMSQSADQFMRSERFLSMMKQSMDASIAFRKQLDEFLTSAWHAGQGVARQDVDTLMLTVRHFEQRVLDRMEELTGRLEALGRKLDAIEASTRGGGNGNAPPPQPSAGAPVPMPPRRKEKEKKGSVQE